MAATSAGEAPAAQRTSASKSALRVASSTRSLSAVLRAPAVDGATHGAERGAADGVAAPFVAHLPAISADPMTLSRLGPVQRRRFRCRR